MTVSSFAESIGVSVNILKTIVAKHHAYREVGLIEQRNLDGIAFALFSTINNLQSQPKLLSDILSQATDNNVTSEAFARLLNFQPTGPGASRSTAQAELTQLRQCALFLRQSFDDIHLNNATKQAVVHAQQCLSRATQPGNPTEARPEAAERDTRARE